MGQVPLAYPAGHQEQSDFREPPLALFRLMSPAQQQVLLENTARSISGAPKEIQLRHIGNCLKADSAYGQDVAGSWVSRQAK